MTRFRIPRNRHIVPLLLAALACTALLVPAPADARSRHRRHHIGPRIGHHGHHRSSHHHYYPRHRYYSPYRGYYYGYYSPYYWNDGYWVTRTRTKVIVPLAVGTLVASLPPFYETIWVDGTPFYFKDANYYRWSAQRDGYIVVSAPGDQEPAAPASDAALSAGLFVYPTKGQSVDQQADDRYECHTWAVEQTGFDPTAVREGERESEQQRTGYIRASTACLEGRDYTVK